MSKSGKVAPDMVLEAGPPAYEEAPLGEADKGSRRKGSRTESKRFFSQSQRAANAPHSPDDYVEELKAPGGNPYAPPNSVVIDLGKEANAILAMSHVPVEDSPMSLLQGETKLIHATQQGIFHICAACCPRSNTSIMLTDRRLVYRWTRRTCVCLPSYQREESFSYRDVQFAYTQRGFNYTWMWLGLICIALGIAFIVVKVDPSWAAGVLIGLGVAFIIFFIIGLIISGTWLMVSYSRPAIRIHDWDVPFNPLSGVCGGAAYTQRMMRMAHAEASALMYIILQHPLAYNGRPHAAKPGHDGYAPML